MLLKHVAKKPDILTKNAELLLSRKIDLIMEEMPLTPGQNLDFYDTLYYQTALINELGKIYDKIPYAEKLRTILLKLNQTMFPDNFNKKDKPFPLFNESLIQTKKNTPPYLYAAFIYALGTLTIDLLTKQEDIERLLDPKNIRLLTNYLSKAFQEIQKLYPAPN